MKKMCEKLNYNKCYGDGDDGHDKGDSYDLDDKGETVL